MLLFSILGDSISTYTGYNPCGYAVFYDDKKCIRNGIGNTAQLPKEKKYDIIKIWKDK